MSYIKQLKDKSNVQVYPVTTEDAVRDKNGLSLASKVSNLSDNLTEYNVSSHNNGQKYTLTAAVAAVPSEYRKGGLSVTFISSSTNLYETWSCTAKDYTVDTYYWRQYGVPTTAQTTAAVNSWMNAHPEASTTVLDGSITTSKLNPYIFDTEDIKINVAGGNVQFADRLSGNGMNYIILRKNKSFESQVTTANTIYEIRYDFNLGGKEVTIPSNCVLKFEGGSLSNGTLKGNILNKIIYSSWFKDNISLLGAINNLNGFETIEFEQNKTFLFDDVISPTHSITINGNGCTIGRSDVTNYMSKPMFKMVQEEQIEFICLKNINFDGGVPTNRHQINIDDRVDVFYIKNVSNIELRNLRFENYNQTGRINTPTPPNPYEVTYNTFIQAINYHHAVMDGVVFINNRIYAEVTNFVPVNVSITSTDTLEIKNCVFDFRNERCYTAINCFGRLFCTKNEIYGVRAGLNLGCNDSFITDNIYADSENGFVDLSEQGMFKSKNILITNNIIRNIKDSTYGTNKTHLVEGYGVENIRIIGNIYEPSDEGTGAVFVFTDESKNIDIANNRLLCNGVLFSNVKGTFIDFVHFSGNYVYQADNVTPYSLIDAVVGDNIVYTNNYFKITAINRIIRCDKNGQTIKNFTFNYNRFDILSENELTLFNNNNGDGDYASLINFTIANNICNSGNLVCYINNNGGTLIHCIGNRGIRVFEYHYANTSLLPNQFYYIDHPIEMLNNSTLNGAYRSYIEFVGNGSIKGNVTINHNNTILSGKSLLNTVTFGKHAFCGETRPTSIIPGDYYYNTVLKKPQYQGSDGITYYESDGAVADVKRFGASTDRPNAADIYVGFKYFDTTLGEPIFWDGTTWRNNDGVDMTGVDEPLVGSTTVRQSLNLGTANVGLKFYDATLGKPMYWDGVHWKDAAGNTES